jgi:tRNA pseudouridine38-40 synthase
VTRWKLTLEYDGAAFCGWQRQDNQPSVQQSLEEAVTAFCKETPSVQGSGRTDSGVHALGQVAHVDIQYPATGEVVRDALNHFLRNQMVCVHSAEAVPDDFHARFSAKQRHYWYRLINRRVPLVLEKDRATRVNGDLKAAPMQEAANLMVGGIHDFSTFRAAACQSKSPIKTLDSARIETSLDEFHFYFSARSFLYHQVRNMVGSLLLVGLGEWSVDDFKRAFEAKDRSKGGPTAPAEGLYFHHVDY